MKKAAIVILALMMVISTAYAEEITFSQLADLVWTFASGVGGWSTELYIAADGSFTGEFHDSDLGDAEEAYPNGTRYYCAFSGKMSLGNKMDAYSWEVKVDRLQYESDLVESIEDGVRVVPAQPYGISEGDVMRLYMPGTPLEKLSEDMRLWTHALDADANATETRDWFLCSEKNDSGFVGETLETIGQIANPWQDVTQEQLTQLSGLSFGVPEKAENVIYRWLESASLAEMQFMLDGDEYIARIKPDALQAGEVDNISGMYFVWDHEEAVKIGHCDGTVSLAQTGSEDWVELCLWYDLAPGLMYSLSVYTTDPDGLDLTAVAEMVYLPAQGDSDGNAEETAAPDGLHASVQHVTDSPAWVTALPAAQDENVKQLFIVAGLGMDKTTATISMHQRDENGVWKQILSTPGFVGKNGLCLDEDHREGCGQTPIGVYRFNKAFGIAQDPGCAIPYIQVDDSIYWSGDPDYHYNEMMNISDYPGLAMDDSEHIVDYEYQYQYCLNISFNEEGTPGRGSAIFLHCFGPVKPYTGGCVALPENIMKLVMQSVREDCTVVIDTLENLGGSL